MKTGFLLRLFASLPLFAAFVFAQPKDEAFSENRKFSAEISETELNKPVVAVFARDDDKPKLVWSRGLKGASDLEDNHGNTFGAGRQIRKSVSNDGTVVILRPEYANGDEPAVRILAQKGLDARFASDDLTALIEDAVDEDYSNIFSSGTPMFDVILEKEKPPIYALWIPAAEQWLVFSLEKQGAGLANKEQAARLNELGLTRAREIVSKRPGANSLSQMLGGLRRRAASVLPGLVEEQSHAVEYGQIQVAFRFLAAQKKPEDKPLIEKLLDGKVQGIGTSSPYGDKQFGALSNDRLLAEELLAKWDGYDLEEFDLGSGIFFNRRKLRRFGAIDGTVYLPFKNPDQAGPLWLHIIPANVPLGDWTKDESVIRTQTGFNDMAMFGAPGRRPQIRYDKVRFALDTLTPGDYRLKAVWDRRTPARKGPPIQQELGGLPEAGDYESVESKPFRVVAGERITGVQIDCTNRVGQAAEYFEADAKWAELNPANRDEDPVYADPSRVRQKTLLSKPVADWVIRTNENTGEIAITRVRLIEQTRGNNRPAGKKLLIRFSAPAPKNRNDWANYQARLEDEHGCRFTAGGSNLSRRSHELHFETAPFGAKQFKLVITLQNSSGTTETVNGRLIGASFLLTNLCNLQPEQWTADAIPARRDLDLVTVELNSLNPSAPEYSAEYLARFPPGFNPLNRQQVGPPENKYGLSKGGQPAPGWRKVSGRYQDRWGNEAPTLAQFCAEEELFKLSATFARDPDRSFYRPEEIWEVPVPRIPGPGESVPLNLANELQGLKLKLYSIGGTGEFTYDDGRLVSATNQLADGGFNARFNPNSRVVQPKLFIANREQPGSPFYYGARRPPGPVVLGAKMPHLACRIPETGGDPLFALLEEDTSVPEPMNTPPDRPGGGHWGGPRPFSSLKFLPLDYRPGETDKKLTFIVQKLRTADFIIKVPKHTRDSARQSE